VVMGQGISTPIPVRSSLHRAAIIGCNILGIVLLVKVPSLSSLPPGKSTSIHSTGLITSFSATNSKAGTFSRCRFTPVAFDATIVFFKKYSGSVPEYLLIGHEYVRRDVKWSYVPVEVS